LPPSVFTHAPLKKVLKEVKSALPSGLFLTTALKEEDMWAAHQEARVVAAAIPQSIRQLSINELQRTFSLFRVVDLAQAIKNGTLTLWFTTLPDFRMDHQTLVELPRKDAELCLRSDRPVCPVRHTIKNKIMRETPAR
jgi:hypothetical protein